ncbi:plasmid partitioning/stability family protein [Erwinia amylovora]|uniref:plasmid partitioning/stability family protein n=1 Tax=Erwinia amylovora TaxID=552 RepID=UPI001443D0FD|nr:plasmid partitioning/stability family protein [Erwinia amylovora]
MERRKFTLYMHPDEEPDRLAMEVLESVSQRTRGDFLRTSVISGCALHQIDKRLPLLVATLFNGKMTPSQLVAMIRQTTGWKPDEAEIREVVAALRVAVPESQKDPSPVEEDRTLAFNNMQRMFPK